MTVALVLVVPAWLTLAYGLITLVERSTPPVPRIVARPAVMELAAYRPAITTPAAVFGAYSDDDTVTWMWRGRRPRPAPAEAGPAFPGPLFPTPPSTGHTRQPRTDPTGRIPHTTTVARAWDEWEERQRPLPKRRPVGRIYVVPHLSRVDHHADTRLMKAIA